MATSVGAGHVELRALYQGFCYIRTLPSSPSSSSPSFSSSWRKRVAVILEYGLIFFDPAAGQGSPVDKIRAHNIGGARLLSKDPLGRTLEILLVPSITLQVHLSSPSIAQHWIDILNAPLLGAFCDPAHEVSQSCVFKADTELVEDLRTHEFLNKDSEPSGRCLGDCSNSFKRGGCSSSWSNEGHIERNSVDVLSQTMVHENHGDSLSLYGLPAISAVEERDGLSSGPLSMLSSPETVKLSEVRESSSESSLSGLTLTSDSSEKSEALKNGLDPLEAFPSMVEEGNYSCDSNLGALDERQSHAAQPDLASRLSSQASLTSKIKPEKLSENLSKEGRDSFLAQEVTAPESPFQKQELTQLAVRHSKTSEELQDSVGDSVMERNGQANLKVFGASNNEEVMQRQSNFMRRSYLHIRILECWLNEEGLEEKVRAGLSSSLSYFNIVASLYHGGEKLAQCNELSTTFIFGCKHLRWNELLTFPILLYDLPQEVRLNFALYYGVPHGSDEVESKLVGWTNFCFIDENGVFKAKKHSLRLWKDPPFFSCGTFAENTTEDFSGVLNVELDYHSYSLNLHHREDMGNEADFSDEEENDLPTPTDEELDLLDNIISSSDVITPPTEAQKHLLWQSRHALVNKSLALPKFLMSVPWSKHRCVLETHRILARWKPLPPFYALQVKNIMWPWTIS